MLKKIILCLGLAALLLGCEATPEIKINVNKKNKPKNVLFWYSEKLYNWGWDLNNDKIMDESLHIQNTAKYFNKNMDVKKPTNLIKEMDKIDWWHFVADGIQPEQQYLNTTENTIPMHDVVRKLMNHASTLPERKEEKEGRYKLDEIE